MGLEFSDINGSINAIQKTWNELKLSIIDGEIKEEDYEKAKDLIFLKQFDDLFFKSKGFTYCEKTLEQVFNNKYVLRGANLDKGVRYTVNRFIPDSSHMKKASRFSPKNKEWIYLGVGEDREEVKKGCIRECRGPKDGRFGIYEFRLCEDFNDAKVVDLTIADDQTYEEINKAFKNFVKKFQNDKKTWRPYKKKYALEWSVKTYCKLLSNEIFIPVESPNGETEYLPFHILANYFESKGYAGIIYKSTVCDNAKNIVLFNKDIVYPFGEMEDFIVGN